MSKEVDALILIGHGHRIVADVPEYVLEDVESGLWYLRDGRKKWYNGVPITESDRTNLYASDVLLRLGHLAASVMKNEPLGFIENANPHKFNTVDTLNELSPYKDDGSLLLPVGLSHYQIIRGETGIPVMFEEAVSQKPSILQELMAKWAISKQVHAEHGTVEGDGYNIDELLSGVGTVDIDEVAPVDITGSSHSLGDIIDHAGLKSQPMNFPYYQTLKAEENAVEMLESALEDLAKVMKAIQ